MLTENNLLLVASTVAVKSVMAPVDPQFKLTDQQNDSLLYLIQHSRALMVVYDTQSPSFGLRPSSKNKIKKKSWLFFLLQVIKHLTWWTP